MEGETQARAILAKLYAERFGRAVPVAELAAALVEHAIPVEAIDRLIEERLVRVVPGGLAPVSPPLATRSPGEIAMASWLHR